MTARREHHHPDGRRLPRGRHGLPRAFVVRNQRDRIFASLATVCALKGYAEVTVQDITQHAGVSRRTFYDLFSDKEQCFLAAYDQVIERLLAAVSAAYWAGEVPWPERIAAALKALVGLYMAEPDFARLITVEVLGAGHRALAHRDAALRQFAVFFEAGTAGLPASMEDRHLLVQAVIGGLYEILYSQIMEGKTERLPELLPELMYCVLVPYLGHGAAIAARDAARLAAAEAAVAEPSVIKPPPAPEPGESSLTA
jgi:AcrR family transcriptional regulator